MLDFVEKIPKGYILHYIDDENNNKSGILLPNDVFNEFTKAKIGSSCKYTIHFPKKYGREDLEVRITKAPQYDKSKEVCYVKLEFDDNILYAAYGLFKKKAKPFCFQSIIDVKIYDMNGNILSNTYRFLKCYDTKSKAIYFTRKLAHRFSNLYKKYHIENKVVYDASNNLDLVNGNIIYELECVFNSRIRSGIAVYTFTVLSVEAG
jgi:hypothetical protein